MELVYLDGSPFARIVRILIQEWKLPVVCTEVCFPLPPEIDALTPLGQVPLLLREGQQALFPTLNIIECLSRFAAEGGEFQYSGQTRETLVVALSAGDSLAQAAYQHWSGLGPVSDNGLGFEPGARNLDRFTRSVRWLAENAEAEKIVCLAVAVFLYWARDRKVADLDLDDACIGRFETFFSRPSFKATIPRPHGLAAGN
ncbi:MAG: glutathione S-transferase N-terminal domain-containing protein [Leisingera sp.]